MIEVWIEDSDRPDRAQRNLDRGLKDFRRAVINAGIFDELRKRKHAMKPSVMAKYKKAVAAKKRARRRKRARENQAMF
jgi:ribosomal protein S21